MRSCSARSSRGSGPSSRWRRSARVDGLRVVFAGEPIGSEGERLLERLRERAARPDLDGRVELRGRVEDPRPALEGASVLLHCADREPFGIAMIEALAARRAGGRAGERRPDRDRHQGLRPALPARRRRSGRAGAARVPGPAGDACGSTRTAATFDAAATREGWREAVGAVQRHSRVKSFFAVPDSGTAKKDLTLAVGDPAVGDLAYVTVTHNSARDLERLLRSLPAGARVVVVDAASTDDSVAVARAHGARVIEGDNAGYGAAANAGVAACDAAVAVVLNPDVELVDDSLDALAAAVTPDRILVPLVLLPDGSRQDIAHNGPAGWSDLAIALGPPTALPEPLRTKVEPWRAHAPRKVDWPVGACIAGRTDTLRRLGPFDPAIFLYSEDLDLGLRAQAAGIETGSGRRRA